MKHDKMKSKNNGRKCINIKQSIVRQINEDEDSFFGCTFPLTYVGGSDGFFQELGSVKKQKSNIKNCC